MSARYTSVPNPRSAPDAEQELDDAFLSDNEDDGTTFHESTPLTHNNTQRSTDLTGDATSSIPGTYDFEREYDYPPPGSPPRPSARALPNDYGNSNGELPISPVRISPPRPSFFRRAVGALLPSHYVRVPTESQSSRARGGGIENDGVFANVMAKPQRTRTVQMEDGDVHFVPEDNQKEVPPVSNLTCSIIFACAQGKTVVLCRCTSRCSTPVLGDNSPCSCIARTWRRHDH